jgi:hypothetical protein
MVAVMRLQYRAPGFQPQQGIWILASEPAIWQIGAVLSKERTRESIAELVSVDQMSRKRARNEMAMRSKTSRLQHSYPVQAWKRYGEETLQGRDSRPSQLTGMSTAFTQCGR